MARYSFHGLTQFLNISYMENLKVDEITAVNIYNDVYMF